MGTHRLSKKDFVLRLLTVGVLVCVLATLGVAFFLVQKKHFTISSEASLAAVVPAVLLARTNTDRVIYGAPLLLENALLSKAAQMKADDMLQRGYYSHTTPEGHSPLYFVDKVGYKYLNIGENLDLTYVQTEEDVQTAWMNSPTHRANLLFKDFTEVGVGVASGVYQGEQVTFAVQIYATPLPPPRAPSPKVFTEVPIQSLKKASRPNPVTVVPRVVVLEVPSLAVLLPSLPTSTVYVATNTPQVATPTVVNRTSRKVESKVLPVLAQLIQEAVRQLLRVFTP